MAFPEIPLTRKTGKPEDPVFVQVFGVDDIDTYLDTIYYRSGSFGLVRLNHQYATPYFAIYHTCGVGSYFCFISESYQKANAEYEMIIQQYSLKGVA